MQKGRRETFAEKLGSWDLINGRPLEGSSVTGKGHTHTRAADLQPFYRFLAAAEIEGIRGKSRKGESKWARWSSEVFLRVIPHRRRTLQNKQTPPITSDFATKKCPSCFEPS